MSILSAKEKSQLQAQPRPFGLADQILNDISNYQFDINSVKSYASSVKGEIVNGATDLRALKKIRAKPHLWFSERRLRDQALHGQDPVERDQAVWELISADEKSAADLLIESVSSAPNAELATSALLALHKVAHHNPVKVADFLNELSTDTNTELAEWSRLCLLEMAASLPGRSGRLSEPVSTRDFVHSPLNVFDVTMPLIFHCHAFTKVGPITLHNVISPEWFSRIFGRAMACVRQGTFLSNLILEKSVSGLHDDGSPHFEHFPFSGTTDQLAAGVFRHNYWAHLYRPFYTSGRTEVVTPQCPVIRAVPMTFCRLACTYTPERYMINEKPIPESVRGLFFGYGHISPKVLIQNKGQIRAGDFQLSSKINPETGKPANTYFFGTFFGKLCDWDGDGKLDINTRPVHCDASGQLDYWGDGTMAPDPVCPDDWGLTSDNRAEASVMS